MPIAPFTPQPGQGIAWAFPTITDNGASDKPSACSHYPGCGGSVSSDLNGGLLTVTAIGFWNEWWMMRWYGFEVSLPPNATINSIYAVAEAAMWDASGDFDNYYSVGGAHNLIAPGGGVSSVSFNGPPSTTSEPPSYGTYYRNASIGNTAADITNASIIAQFYGGSVGGLANLRIVAPRLAVYYDAPVMPIGHAANCNAYDPITVHDGATTPPGNGILIDL